MNDYLWSVLASGLLLVCSLMVLVWAVGSLKKNAGWVDLGWVLGLVVLAFFYALMGDGEIVRRGLIAMLVMLWGLRLGGMLLRRLLREEEDNRYQKIRASFGSGADFKFFLFFQFQAILDVILAVPFLIICFNPAENILAFEWFGVGVWIAGFAGEAMADNQLQRFKKDPQNKGKVCESGLWYYSRHPNYFFEWLMWVGYFLIAMGSPAGWVGVIAPVLMLYFLLQVSGVPLAEEQSLRSRGEAFRQYQKTTSVFIPLPKWKV